MGKILSGIKKNHELIFCIVSILLLVLMCIPLLVIAKYNYMSSDDFRYGVVTHQAIQNGQPWKIFGLAAQQAIEKYFTWQGSFSAIFLFALQPGIWGEKYYQIGTYIIISSLLIMQFVLIYRIEGTGKKKVNWKCRVGFWAFMCMVQIFYVPYPGQCFYWFNGGLYYTFFYTLQLLLFSEILVMYRFPAKFRGKQRLFYCWMMLLAMIIGGGNLATGLSTALVLFLLTAMEVVKKDEYRFYILAIFIVYMFGFAINMAAPGNAIRGQDPGYHPMSPISTVFVAAWHCMLNIYSWTNYKMLLLLLSAIPFLWQLAGVIMENWKFTFRLPAIAMVFLFGIYASQLAPITFMEGNYGPERMGDMMWFGYVFWIFTVEGYWLGWFRHRFSAEKVVCKIKTLISGCYGILQVCFLALWCILVLVTDVRSSSTYKAWAAIKSGEAEEYAAENEARLEVLRNPEIIDVYFHELEHRVEPIFVFDLGANNQDLSNTSMAEFYNKNTVNLIEE